MSGLRLFLEQLRGLAKQLAATGKMNDVLLAYSDAGAKETIEELGAFVKEMAKRTTWIRLRVWLNEEKAEALVKKLHRHEEEIMQTVMFTSVWV